LYLNDLECFALESELRLTQVKETLLKEFAVVMRTGSSAAFFCSAPLHREVQFMDHLLYDPVYLTNCKEQELYVP
jgi:hypothetical protein